MSVNYEEQDVALWRRWKQTQSEQDLRALMERFRPLVRAHIARHYAGRVQFADQDTLEFMGMEKVLEAIKHYDPNRGPLGSFVKLYLRNLQSEVAKFQNIGYVPPARVGNINQIQMAVEVLRDQLGREPSATEIADYTGLPLGDVSKALAEGKYKVASLSQTDAESWDAAAFKAGTNLTQIRILMQELSPDEQVICEYLYGLNGRPRIEKQKDLARKLGVSEAKISRVKNKLKKLRKQYGW